MGSLSFCSYPETHFSCLHNWYGYYGRLPSISSYLLTIVSWDKDEHLVQIIPQRTLTNTEWN
jgi:hypothetical protein